ncbi:MAG: alpha-amylase family glycosyl hydrolase [Treponema sp.]|nr:alpha-amylase family glycosyl hydrolase [Treponema sp.]
MSVYRKAKNIFILFALIVLTGCGLKAAVGESVTEPVKDNYRTYYQIFVGAFSDSNKDGIGDLGGVTKRLDYLNDGSPNSGKSLGIDGIWFLPVMPSPSYHKYDVTNYRDIDRQYGTMADFENLIAESNKRGIAVIIDLVINHTSSQHPWFVNARNAVRNGDFDDPFAKYYALETEISTGKTWRRFEISPDGTQYYYEANFADNMPELDLDNPEVRREITEIVQFWLDKGVAGFRLDAVKYFYLGEDSRNIQFLKWFNDECKRIKDDVYIVAENWSGTVSVQNYYEAVNCFDFSMSGSDGHIYYTAQGIESVTEFVQHLASYQKQVLNKNPQAIMNPFISNHDMDRAAGYLSVEEYRMHMAANLYILSCGNPFIYYGEEIGMRGSRGSEQTDANRRLAMLWGDRDTVRDPRGSTYNIKNQINGTVKSQMRKNNSLVNHYKNVIKLRNANPEIARGAIEVLDFSQYTAFGGFVSDYEGSVIAVFHNTGENDITVDLENYTDIGFSVVRGYAGKGKSTLNGNILTVSGYTSVILK